MLPLHDIETDVAATRRFRFDESTVGPALMAWLARLLPRAAAMTLTDCAVRFADASGLRVVGTSNALMPGATVGVDAVLFDAADRSRRECLLWLHAEDETSSISSYVRAFRPSGRADTIADLVTPDPLRVVLSSVAGSGSLQAARVLYPSEWTYPWDRVQAGANFVATLDPDAAEALAETLGGDHGSAPVYGVIRDNARVELRWGATVRHQVGPVGIAFTGLEIRSALVADDADQEALTIGATGRVTINQQPFDVAAAFDPSGHILRVSVEKPPSLSAMIGSTNAAGDSAWEQFRTTFAALMDRSLATLWIDVTWEEDAPGSVAAMGFALEATTPIDILPGWITIQPRLDMRLVQPFDADARHVEGTVRGVWTLSERTRLDTQLRYPDGAFSVGLAPGSTVDFNDVARRFGADGVLPQVTFDDPAREFGVTLELSGNVFATMFVARLGAHGATSDLADGVTLSRLMLEVEYQAGTKSFSLEAVLSVHGHEFDIRAAYEEGWELSGAYRSPSIALATLTRDILDRDAAGRAPERAPLLPLKPEDFTLTDVFVSARFEPGTYTLELEGRTSGPFSLGGLALGVEHFGARLVKDTAGTRVNGRLIVTVTIPDTVVVRLGGEKQDDGWRFEGSTGPGQKIPIGRVISHLATAASDIAVPPVLANFTIQDLGITFDTRTEEFRFTCTGDFPVDANVDVALVVVITVAKGKATFDGSMTVAVDGRLLRFHVSFDRQSAPGAATRTAWVATYLAEKNPLTMRDLLKAMRVSAPETGATDIALESACVAYTGGGDAAEKKFLVGVRIGGFSLPEVPLVQKLSPGLSLGVEHLQILAASRAFRATEIEALSALLGPDAATAAIPKPASVAASGGEGRADAIALSAGVSVGATLRLGETTHALALPEAIDAKPDASSRPSAEPRAPEASLIPASSETQGPLRKWITVDKTLGPLALHRIGGEWDGANGRLGVLFDAGVDLFGLRVGLAGLKVSLPVKDPTPAKLTFDLDGLDLAFKSGPVEISGGLLHVTEGGRDEFRGTALIKTEVFGISGFGAYTVLATGPSLFIYALLDKDLGGPPCFHVTGLAAGFGYNRALKIPEIEKIHEFPLIRAAMDPAKAGNFSAMADDMATFIPAAAGEYWLAAGVRFTSFQMIQSFALVALTFGTEVVITGLGLSRLTVPAALPAPGGAPAPAPADTIALVEVALKIVLRPQTGILTAEARLTPASYVFSKDCHLSGGFAFYLWFKDVPVPGKSQPIPAGDFVVTLGGYHPRFEKPDHYPAVPRLALDWKVSSKLTVAGEVYFALTPTCLMAGGRLSAVFQDGNLRAWFEAYAHFFIAWKPVQYDVDIGIRIGVSYRLAVLGIVLPLSIEMSASVHLWGPPFAGKATIDWTVISFTVYFGESRVKPTPPALEWPDFAKSFLPGTPGSDEADPLTVAVVRGVVTEVKPGRNGEPGYVVVNPHEAGVIVKSAVPCTTLAVNGAPPLTGTAVGIAPMSIATLETSAIDVKVEHDDTPVTLTVSPITQNAPGALWGPKAIDPRAPQKPELIAGVLTGVELAPPPPPTAVKEVAVQDLEKRYDRLPTGALAWRYCHAISGQRYDPRWVEKRLTSSRTDDGDTGRDVRPVRRAFLEALAGAGLIAAIPGDVDDTYRDMLLEAPPVDVSLTMLPLLPADSFRGSATRGGG